MSDSLRRDNSNVRLLNELKQALRERFENKYKLGKRISWEGFFRDWSLELDTPLPTQPSVRTALDSESRNFCEYRIADGLCQLLLGRSYDEWNNQIQLLKDCPAQPEISAPNPELAREETEFSLPRPYHNLLAPEYTTFIGRHSEINRLLEWLSWDNPVRRISAIAMGGMGKTTLLQEAAYRCLAASRGGETAVVAPKFDAIIFTSAQPQRLAGCGLLRRLKRESTLRDIFRAIARTLNCFDITSMTVDEQIEWIRENLARQRTLLIVDNLETLEEREDVLSFLHELPPTVKVAIASREWTQMDVIINLEPLPEESSLFLIESLAREKALTPLRETVRELYKATSGVPAAIAYAIGQLAGGYLLEDVLRRKTFVTGDIARFLFQGSVTPLQGQPAHWLLMAIALFPKSALRGCIAFVVGETDAIALSEGLVRLQQLSLIKYQKGRYQMLPLTRGYVLAELETYPDFERSVRERWVNWYLKFSSQHGNKDWKEWNEYAEIEEEWENLQAAIEWCISQNWYAEFRQFWQHVKCYSHVRGYYRDRLTYWDTHLEWTDWLIQAAQQHRDWATAAEAMCDRGWTLTLMGKPEHLKAACVLFKKAWNFRQHKDLRFQLELAINIAVLRRHQPSLKKAAKWLSLGENLLKQSQLEEPIAKRFSISLFYYQGEISFRKGEFTRSEFFYQQALEQAQLIDWKRAIYCAQNWLADIAIEQGNFEKARQLLESGLRIARSKKDKCRAAFCKRSIAFLQKACGKVTSAWRWAESASEDFLTLGMMSELAETRSWLETLTTKLDTAM